MLIFKYKACTITRFIQPDNIKITEVDARTCSIHLFNTPVQYNDYCAILSQK
ncbi:hypothetical protein GMJAKD_17645 [Candidatus Electrothrix aarhusensis]